MTKFELWKQRVEVEVLDLCGIPADDLPDMPYYDMFDDGFDPHEAAKEVILLAEEEY